MVKLKERVANQVKPRVSIAVVGRFHGFDLARELNRRGYLNRLLTTYPKFITKRWEISRDKTRSEPILEFVRRFGPKYLQKHALFLDRQVHRGHALNAKKLVRECDIFIGWSGSSLEALIEAKKWGTITILERGPRLG